MKRVMFYCQHVLGMGHLVRSTAIARALAEKYSVLLVVGGKITQEFSFLSKIERFQLPALQSTLDFTSLQVCDSPLSLEETKALRSRMLLDVFDRFQPDALITELFPFGRKQFKFELIPLLERAKGSDAKPLIVSSIRDILVTKKDQATHERRVCKVLNNFYDLVLVHGDAKFQRLEETFGRVEDLRCAIEYTGYVVQQKMPAAADAVELGANDKPAIVVSNGSGGCPAGQTLLERVVGAAQMLQGTLPHRFHVFAGPLMPSDAYERLEALAAGLPNVRLARYTPDLPGYLRQAELSISMCGYNTMMDVLSSRVRTLVFPETAHNDQEQVLRAGKLEELGVLRVLDREHLEPGRLVREIQEGLRSTPSTLALNVLGAENTSLVLEKYLAAGGSGASQNNNILSRREEPWGPGQRHEIQGASMRGSTCE